MFTMKILILMFFSSLSCFSESKLSLNFITDPPIPKYPYELREIFRELFSSKKVCIWTKRSTEQTIKSLLKEIHTFHDYSVTHVIYGEAEIDSTQCINNIVFNYDFIENKMLFKYDPISVWHVFLIIDTMGNDLEEMRKQKIEPKFKVLKIFSNAKVILLTEHQVYKFTTPFFPPRHLRKVLSLADLDDEEITDLNGRVVNIATFNCSLFSILNGPINSDSALTEHDGIEMRMMRELASHLNMTPNIVNAQGFGWMFDNGTWNGGLAGLLQDGAAEIGFCNIWNTVRYNRVVALGPQWNQVTCAGGTIFIVLNVYEFLYVMFLKMYYTFMVPRPVMIHGYWMSVVTLFHNVVWILLLMTCFLVTILFWKFKKNQHTNGWFTDLVESLLAIFASFLGQSTHLPPCYISSQRIIVSWSIFSFFMSAILNNTMISRLMVPHQSGKIDTVQDFVLGGYHWGEEAYSNFQQEVYFNMKDPWHKKMEDQFQRIRSHEMKAAIQSRRFGFPVQRLGNEYVFILQKSINQSEIDGFRLMKETINQFHVSMVFSKLSPMLKICRIPILRFLETGLIVHWKNEVIRKYGSKNAARLLSDPPNESVSAFEPLTVDNNLAAFQILLYGWSLSLLVFFVELFTHEKFRVKKVEEKREKNNSDVPFEPYFYCE